MIRVVHGANQEYLAVESTTIGATRKLLRDVCNIPADASAFVLGRLVPDEHTMRSGDSVEFLREWGEKGLGRLLDRSQLIQELGISEKDYDYLVTIGLPIVELDDRHLHPEVAVDHFFEQLAHRSAESKPEVVDSTYVSKKLGCTATWIAEQARDKVIPPACVVEGTGHGKPWKFHRRLIDKWISHR